VAKGQDGLQILAVTMTDAKGITMEGQSSSFEGQIVVVIRLFQ
jgi:hypothetical protein